jgi:hypothetical protein
MKINIANILLSNDMNLKEYSILESDKAQGRWDKGVSYFNVDINGVRELTNYDVYADAGGEYKGIEKVFSGISVTGSCSL